MTAVTKLEWQSPLEIIKYPDPRLRASNASVGCFDGSLRKISEEMFELMYQYVFFLFGVFIHENALVRIGPFTAAISVSKIQSLS